MSVWRAAVLGGCTSARREMAASLFCQRNSLSQARSPARDWISDSCMRKPPGRLAPGGFLSTGPFTFRALYLSPEEKAKRSEQRCAHGTWLVFWTCVRAGRHNGCLLRPSWGRRRLRAIGLVQCVVRYTHAPRTKTGYALGVRGATPSDCMCDCSGVST